MKISVSNIAWSAECDEEMYCWLKENGIGGLEIAPSRIFGSAPYEHIPEAAQLRMRLLEEFGLEISSMQSILFGISENLFASETDWVFLREYLGKACAFAETAGCGNLVFGCPKNRRRDGRSLSVGREFFAELAGAAETCCTHMAIEANPVIYNTDYINRTDEAFALSEDIGRAGITVNLDMGTVIYNGEDLSRVAENMGRISHVHISEPYLAPVEKRDIHRELAEILAYNGYDRFVSVEMKNQERLDDVKRAVSYVQEVFA